MRVELHLLRHKNEWSHSSSAISSPCPLISANFVMCFVVVSWSRRPSRRTSHWHTAHVYLALRRSAIASWNGTPCRMDEKNDYAIATISWFHRSSSREFLWLLLNALKMPRVQSGDLCCGSRRARRVFPLPSWHVHGSAERDVLHAVSAHPVDCVRRKDERVGLRLRDKLWRDPVSW